ncbi:branched-chain amino acid ABC transporter permease [Streptomyces sp. NPDC020490]|uniref:branched-chain amino acid ABC transporter permease n=1 Tax=Streptomyces sp. NPDC020490 TaxID=3365078 RepID=UPI0037B6534B
MFTFIQHLATGLQTGGVLALLSTGLAVIFGVMRVVNFAQGDYVMLGMYAVFFAVGGTSLPALLVAVCMLPVFAGLGALLHWILVSRVTGGKGGGADGHDAQLLLTLGLSLVLQSGVLMAFGANPRSLSETSSGRAWHLGGIVLDPSRTIGFVIAMAAAAALFLFLARTPRGRQLRAAADDPVAATYVGVDVKGAHRLAFAVGIGLAGLGGGILATFYPIHPYISLDFIVLIFSAVVLGGLGSIPGAVIGGLVIGMVQSLSELVLPTQLQIVGVFIVFLAVLYLRPQGLLGKVERK